MSLDTGYHERRHAQRMLDPTYRFAYEQATSRLVRWQDEQIGLGVSRCPRDHDEHAQRPLRANYGAIDRD